jgi:hypothetical protein
MGVQVVRRRAAAIKALRLLLLQGEAKQRYPAGFLCHHAEQTAFVCVLRADRR